MKKLMLRMGAVILGLLILLAPCMEARAEGSMFDSPYVHAHTWIDPESGDAKLHWTTLESFPYERTPYYVFLQSGTRPEYWYREGERITTGITSSLRALQKGEHHYAIDRVGEIPVGWWKVDFPYGRCIHDGTATVAWEGLNVGDDICRSSYYSGWRPYCADCEQVIGDSYIYTADYVVDTIDYVNTMYGYYYICPQADCRHLENEGHAQPHTCKAISWNRYKVVYDPNDPTGFEVQGDMNPSFHMYNNETVYEGITFDPVTHLTRNTYSRFGYTFDSWNTMPDGSGRRFEDEEEIFNLTEYDYQKDPRGTITLYAQWVPTRSTLKIDAGDGSYDGTPGITSIEKGYGETYLADPDKITVGSKYKVSFDTNGGNTISPMDAPRAFLSWRKEEPFKGRIRENTYLFSAPNGNIDTLTALYKNLPIILPTPEREGFSFGGWYEDPGCEIKPVGRGGDPYTPSDDVTLYAKWVDLVLWSYDNYEANGKKGAVDLRWYQGGDDPKTYMLYRSENGTDFTAIDGVGGGTVPQQHTTYLGTNPGERTYTVPYTGFYELKAAGAAGADYTVGGVTHTGGGAVGGTDASKVVHSCDEDCPEVVEY